MPSRRPPTTATSYRPSGASERTPSAFQPRSQRARDDQPAGPAARPVEPLPPRVTGPELLEGLNEHQRAAVTHPDTSLAVIAGAGSGKTSVLTRRIAWLLDQHASWRPGSILAVTFTNKAAREMVARLERLGIPGARGMWVGTFHGLANRFLREHHEAAGLKKAFQILDASDSERLVKTIFAEQRWDLWDTAVRDTASWISSWKDAGLRPGHVPTPTREMGIAAQAYGIYQQRCDDNSWVDFGELLLRTVDVLEQHPDILLAQQTRFAHVLVDEFQDTNVIQYKWLALLTSNGSAVPTTIVGDMDQSIYSWRGARMGHVQEFVESYADARMIKLEQNYRSTGHILAAANAVIAHNGQRIDKTLWTASDNGTPVVLVETDDDRAEARHVVQAATEQRRRSGRWRDTAVLYRFNYQSRQFEEALTAARIPYRIHGGVRFFDRQEVRDALAHLAVLADRTNDLALERALGAPTKGFGEKSLDAVRSWGAQKRGPGDPMPSLADLLDAAQNDTNVLSARARGVWTEWSAKWAAASSKSFVDQVTWCVRGTGLHDAYKERDRKEHTDRADNLDELVSAAVRFAEGHSPDEPGLALDFLAAATLESDRDDAKDEQDAVQLMTVHAAKGLEFPTVVLVGWDEDLFPAPRAVTSSDPSQLEEERRLAYVAITRAERTLHIVSARQRMKFGKISEFLPSRFLSEIPEEHAVWLAPPRRGSGRLHHTGRTAVAAPARPKAITPGPAHFWLPGQRVTHPLFGKGRIVRADGPLRSDRVLVRFDDGSQKMLLPLTAKLEKGV